MSTLSSKIPDKHTPETNENIETFTRTNHSETNIAETPFVCSSHCSPEKLPTPTSGLSFRRSSCAGIATESDAIPYEGYIMIVLAALTEAIIYFIVRYIKTRNNWNHLFLSYFLGTFLFTFIGFSEITKITISSNLSISLLINAIIGLCGYLLRFYAATRLDPTVYAQLSYIGIVMAYMYGFIFNGERITIQKVIGTICIIISIITAKQ